MKPKEKYYKVTIGREDFTTVVKAISEDKAIQFAEEKEAESSQEGVGTFLADIEEVDKEEFEDYND